MSKGPKVQSTSRVLAGLHERFAARGWTQGQGVWFVDLIRASAGRDGKPPIAKLTSMVPGSFLTMNRIKRADVTVVRHFDAHNQTYMADTPLGSGRTLGAALRRALRKKS